jgi:hypothetical protein
VITELRIKNRIYEEKEEDLNSKLHTLKTDNFMFKEKSYRLAQKLKSIKGLSSNYTAIGSDKGGRTTMPVVSTKTVDEIGMHRDQVKMSSLGGDQLAGFDKFTDSFQFSGSQVVDEKDNGDNKHYIVNI